jgi:large subunit ribosomal protein L15
MKLHLLPKVITKSLKRVGRGYGSGRGGHTSSRGTKGQNSRNSVPIWFEGGQLPWSRRVPFLRGKDRFKSLQSYVLILNLDDLNKLKDASEVTKESLVKAGVISLNEAADARIKILGQGTLEKKLTIKGVAVSKAAEAKITALGGVVESI